METYSNDLRLAVENGTVSSAWTFRMICVHRLEHSVRCEAEASVVSQHSKAVSFSLHAVNQSGQ